MEHTAEEKHYLELNKKYNSLKVVFANSSYVHIHHLKSYPGKQRRVRAINIWIRHQSCKHLVLIRILTQEP